MAWADEPGSAMAGSGKDYLRFLLLTRGHNAVAAFVQAGVDLLDEIDAPTADLEFDEVVEHDGREQEDMGFIGYFDDRSDEPLTPAFNGIDDRGTYA